MKKITDLIALLYNSHLVRYLFIGGTTFVIDEAILIMLHGVWHVALPLSLFIAYGVAFVYNFSLNRWWNFSASADGKLAKHLVPYAFLFVFNLVFTIVSVSFMSRYINYAVAKALSVALQTTWTFLAYKYLIFVPSKD
jgi:putative flippase GtrA